MYSEVFQLGHIRCGGMGTFLKITENWEQNSLLMLPLGNS